MSDVDQWLWGLPDAGRAEQWEYVKALLAADPVAAAISDLEAEQFLSWAYLVSEAGAPWLETLCHDYGVLGLRRGEKGQHRAKLAVLRRWKWPDARVSMISDITTILYRGYPSPKYNPEAWTDELCAKAYDDEVSVCYLALVRRYLGRQEDLKDWLRSLDDRAELFYRMGLDVARLTLRRLVYCDQPAAPAVAAVAVGAMAQELQAKDQRSGSLRQNVRRLEQDRRQLKESVRRVGRQAQAMLSQARGEVAAARRALRERGEARERELAEQQRRCEEELARLRAETAAVRAGFTRSLRRLPAVEVLRGQSVAVVGAGADEVEWRLLVESVGAAFVSDGGSLTVPATAGFAGLEGALRDAGLAQVVIKTDGLCRRKGERPAISVSAFEAYIGGETVCSTGRTVCCGPLAGARMAEYGALALALAWLLKAGAGRGAQVEVRSDCRPLVQRLNGELSTPLERGCVLLDRQVRRQIARLERRGVAVQVTAVHRDEVYAVDRLCDRVYREQTWYHRPGGLLGVRVKDFLMGIK